MLIVPLILGIGLSWLGISGPPHLVLMLQMGMPPAFATLVIAEAYNLDREMTVTALAVGFSGNTGNHSPMGMACLIISFFNTGSNVIEINIAIRCIAKFAGNHALR
jgi:hypothetical protein